LTECDCNNPDQLPGCIDTWHSGGGDGWGDLFNQLADLYAQMDPGGLSQLRAQLSADQGKRLMSHEREKAYLRIDGQLASLLKEINASPPKQGDEQKRHNNNLRIRAELERLIKEARAPLGKHSPT
jgi:hypothetical protein